MVAASGLADAAIQDFRARLRGELLQPGDMGYDSARTVWNAMIDRHPGLIARCVGAADVIAAVDFGREQGMLVSVRGGGHNVAGSAVCDDGLMIDLSPMKSIRVDPVARTARAEAGVLWGEFDRETQAFGLATVGGVVGTTGIAGLTLGGGQGWLMGKYGLTIDNLISADVVTAGGQLVQASAAENPDLFWGLRGAGANLGIVTSFEYRVHPLRTVLGGMVIHPLDRAREVLRFYREFSATQPDELMTYAAILTAPDGNKVVALVPCYAGAIEQGEAALAPLRTFGSPVMDTIAPIPYLSMQAILTAAFPPGRLNYWKSGLTGRISDELIDAILAHTAQIPSPMTAIAFADLHGAAHRVGNAETAYSHRDLLYDCVILSAWTDPEETDRNIRWTRDLFHSAEPHLSGRTYVNDLDRDEGDERVRGAYGQNYERLITLKAKYDPANFFSLNQNIKVPA